MVFWDFFFFLCEIPVLQTNNGPSLTGLTTIAAHLVKQANKEYLLGSTAEEKAVVQQWLEYRVTRVDGHSSKDDIHTVLKVWRDVCLWAAVCELLIAGICFPWDAVTEAPGLFTVSSTSRYFIPVPVFPCLYLLLPFPGTDSARPSARTSAQIPFLSHILGYYLSHTDALSCLNAFLY